MFEPKWSEERFDDLITGSFSSHGWFKFHRAIAYKIGIEEAVLLQYLIDFHSRLKHSERYEWMSGWFYCTVAKIESELGIAPQSQTRLLHKLVDLDMVEMKKMGIPAKRHLRVDGEKVAAIVSEWEKTTIRKYPVRTENRATSDGENRATLSPTIEDPVLKGRGVAKATPPTRGLLIDEWYMKAAGHLREILVANDCDLFAPPRRTRIDSLAKCLFRIHTERGASKEQIKQMLKDMKVHYSDVHTPKIHKVDDLFTNWGRYKEAQKRWEHDRQQANGQVPVDQEHAKLIRRVRNELFEEYDDRGLYMPDYPVHQEDVDRILKRIGHQPGEVDKWEVIRCPL